MKTKNAPEDHIVPDFQILYLMDRKCVVGGTVPLNRNRLHNQKQYMMKNIRKNIVFIISYCHWEGKFSYTPKIGFSRIC